MFYHYDSMTSNFINAAYIGKKGTPSVIDHNRFPVVRSSGDSRPCGKAPLLFSWQLGKASILHSNLVNQEIRNGFIKYKGRVPVGQVDKGFNTC